MGAALSNTPGTVGTLKVAGGWALCKWAMHAISRAIANLKEETLKKFVTEDSFWQLFPGASLGVIVARA